MGQARRDATPFERALLPYIDDAHTVARCLLRDPADAQDAVQDAFLRALRYYRADVVVDARAWFLTIVRRCCFVRTGRARLSREEVLSDPELASIPDPAPRPDAVACAEDLYDEVKMALDTLPARQREILILREVRQLSYREISEAVGVPLGTVMSRLSRARRSLQRRVRHLVDPEEGGGGRRAPAARRRRPAPRSGTCRARHRDCATPAAGSWSLEYPRSSSVLSPGTVYRTR